MDFYKKANKKIIAGLFAAAAVPTVIIFVPLLRSAKDFKFLAIVFAVMSFHVLLAIPIYKWLQRYKWSQLKTLLTSGFIVGAVPWGILTLIGGILCHCPQVSGVACICPRDSSFILLSTFFSALYGSIPGMIGGLSAWCTWRCFKDKPQPNPE